MITIIDYGAGNIKSIQNMLRKIGSDSCISSKEKEVEQADKIILPGVGHFDYGINNLKQSGLIEVLDKKVVKEKIPLLGICLGAQLLGNSSEEGTAKGLGWIPMQVVKFNKSKLPKHFKIPQMGWNKVSKSLNKEQENGLDYGSMLLEGLTDEARFYFVHSYHILAENKEDILTTTEYGYPFASAVQHENIMGVQFHPEKSHVFGMQLMKNFANL